MKWAVIVLPLALTTCTSPLGDFYIVRVDGGFDDVQRQAITDAEADWLAKVPELRLYEDPYTPCEGTTGEVICIQAAPKWFVDAMTPVPSTVGLTRRDGNASAIWLAVDMPADVFPRVVKHEMGHAFGLVHTAPGTLMCAYTDCMATEVTPADVAQFYSLRGQSSPTNCDKDVCAPSVVNASN